MTFKNRPIHADNFERPHAEKVDLGYYVNNLKLNHLDNLHLHSAHHIPLLMKRRRPGTLRVLVNYILSVPVNGCMLEETSGESKRLSRRKQDNNRQKKSHKSQT